MAGTQRRSWGCLALALALPGTGNSQDLQCLDLGWCCGVSHPTTSTDGLFLHCKLSRFPIAVHHVRGGGMHGGHAGPECHCRLHSISLILLQLRGEGAVGSGVGAGESKARWKHGWFCKRREGERVSALLERSQEDLSTVSCVSGRASLSLKLH